MCVCARVEAIHKGAKAHRPPHIIRRGEALAPMYKAVEGALKSGELFDQSHNVKVNPSETRYDAIDETAEKVLDLVTIQWKDDGDRPCGEELREGRREGRPDGGQGLHLVGGGRERRGEGAAARSGCGRWESPAWVSRRAPR